MFMNRVFHVLFILICSLNIVFDEHFRISDVHGMDEKVYGGQTMSKRKLLTVILLAFVTTLMLACAIIFTACGNNETPDDGHNTEQGGENPSDGNKPGTNPGTDQDDDKDIAVTTVSLDKISLTLEVGESYTLVVTVSPNNATDKSITWSSTNSSVATVSGGKVTAKSEGATTITATAHNGKSVFCIVTVNEPAPEVIEVTSVSLNKTSLTLEIGESETLTATVLPSNATDKSVTWTSSAQTVVTVEDGKVTTIESGTATITATTSNGKTASCMITVIEPAPEVIEVTSVSLDKTSLTLEIGESETLTTTILPNNATDKSVTWTSSDQAVASVANGKITAVGSGTAMITATTSNGKTAICTVTVNAAVPKITQVEGATITGTDIFMLVDHMTDSVALLNKITVSSGRWDLYSDILGQNRIPTKIAAGRNGKLQNGDNMFYIMLENENGDLAEVYTLTIYRSYAVTVSYYNHKDVLVYSDTAYTGYEYELNYDYTTPGYTFNSWTENGITYQSRVLWDDMALHAKMTANSYIVFLNAEGGTLTPSRVDVIYDAEYVLPVPERQGYTFLGWYIDEKQLTDKSGQSLSAWLYAEDSSVMAKWQINQYTVTAEYNEQAGSVTGTGNYDFGTEITLKALAPNLGYTFSGWYHGSDCLTTETIYTFTLSAEDVNLTAKYDVNDEMSVFTFSSTPTACVITCIQDKSVTELIVPDYVTEIEEGAFSGCGSLTCITLPFVGKDASATAASGSTLFGYIFGANTFNGSIATRQYYTQTLYATYSIPSSLKSVTTTGGAILYGAFYNCSGLTSIEIGQNVTSIGDFAFSGCTEITNLNVAEGNAAYCSKNNCLIEIANKTLIFGCSNSTIPADGSVTSIGDYAFGSATLTGSLIIPDGIIDIGKLAFSCLKLTSITIPASVRTIGVSAFANSSRLETVFYNAVNARVFSNTTFSTEAAPTIIIGNSVIAIPDTLFYSLNIKNITFGNSVTNIGAQAFSNCKELTAIVIPNCVTSIGNEAFSNCTKLTQITIGNGVTNIGNRAFQSCTSLTSITIPDSVTTIGAFAFSFCTNLSDILIPDNVKSIGDGAFDGCNKIIDYENDIGYVDKWAVSCNKSLSEVTLRADTVGIAGGAFSDCNIYSIVIPDSVVNIGEQAFFNCANLESITVGTGIAYIDNLAFASCFNLRSVYITDLDAWNAIVFRHASSNPLYYGGTLYLNGEEVTE